MMKTVPPGIVPNKQRAIVQSRYGHAQEVLSLSDSHPVTPPSSSQVQIKVHAASVNPIDWQMMEGNRRLIAARSFPFVLLFDLAGVVTAVGEVFTRFKVGDAVNADNQKDGRGAAEFVNVDQNLVRLKPFSIGFAEAAAIPLAGQTALLALEKGGIHEGSRVCIIGASGGVGSFAVQIAKALGASRVIGVCSGKNSAFVASLGAGETVDYTHTTISEASGARSLDIVIDCVGGREQWIQATKVLVPSGRFVTISRDEDGKVSVLSALSMALTILIRQLRSRWGRKIAYIPVFLKASHGLLDGVNAMVDAGSLRVPINRTSPMSVDALLQEIAESKKGRSLGKSVLVSHHE